ncbi:MAG: hypothetical protein A2Y77_03820 [Planctomycetes bacterium RBG_13_62_9]|nr:MAG: hypothetical protein A2Y77_03820 [Planctomycetes bacterium RBG_13_62_9]
MSTIQRLSPRQAIINFPDFDIRIFVKYRGRYCSAIRIWKLPPRSTFLSMMRSDRLIWAVYGDDAKRLHGWFHSDGDLMKTLASKIGQCKDYEELKGVLIDCERIMRGGYPSGPLFLAPTIDRPTE